MMQQQVPQQWGAKGYPMQKQWSAPQQQQQTWNQPQQQIPAPVDKSAGVAGGIGGFSGFASFQPFDMQTLNASISTPAATTGGAANAAAFNFSSSSFVPKSKKAAGADNFPVVGDSGVQSKKVIGDQK